MVPKNNVKRFSLTLTSGLANEEFEEALYSLILSIVLLVFVFLLGPLIFMFNRNIALMGEVSSN